jgi:hypothetical protein
VALIASVLLTTNAFSANAKKSSQHHKRHSGNAAHSQQQHASKAQHVQSTHHSAANKHSGKAHAHKRAQV